MELHDALSRIEDIHRQLARTEKFHGYGAPATACGAGLAVLAAILQAQFIPRPNDDLGGYLRLWIGTAVAAGLVSAGDAWRRHRRATRGSGVLIRLACEQFLPCVVAGALLTATLVRAAPDVAWMLPGLWAVLFSLGLVASLRLLPGPIVLPAVWYLVTGCVCLALGKQGGNPAPWMMALTFGVGQAGLAAVLACEPSSDAEFDEEARHVEQ